MYVCVHACINHPPLILLLLSNAITHTQAWLRSQSGQTGSTQAYILQRSVKWKAAWRQWETAAELEDCAKDIENFSRRNMVGMLILVISAAGGDEERNVMISTTWPSGRQAHATIHYMMSSTILGYQKRWPFIPLHRLRCLAHYYWGYYHDFHNNNEMS